MNAHLCDVVEVTMGPTNLRVYSPPRESPGWCREPVSSLQLGELMRTCTDERYTLVEAQYLDCDPSISGAFQTKFYLKESFGYRRECVDADWVRPALRDYADFPWEAVWWTREPLFQVADSGPRILRIHLMHPRVDLPVDLFAKLRA